MLEMLELVTIKDQARVNAKKLRVPEGTECEKDENVMAVRCSE